MIWGILAAAWVVRGLYYYFSRSSPFFEPLLLDPAYYHQLAQKIAEGHLNAEPVFYSLPLYPFFLALVYKIAGSGPVAIKLVQTFALGSATIVFTYLSARKIGGEWAARTAALLAAFYGPLFFHENILIPEALGAPLYAAAFWAVLNLVEAPGAARAALAAALCALATLTKANLLLFALLFPPLFLRKPKPALAFLAVYFLTLAPVPLHNWIHGKDKVFLSSHAGFNFYVGNNPGAEGSFTAPEGTGGNVEAQRLDARIAAERAEGRALKPSEVSRWWSAKAWAFIRENPGRFAMLALRKLALFWDAREISDVDDYQFLAQLNPVLRFPWISFAFLGPLVFLGFGGLMHSRFGRLAALWIVCYWAGVILYFVSARYRVPLLPVYFAVAGCGLAELRQALREKRVGWTVFLAAFAACGLALTQLHLAGTDWARDWVNAADASMEKGDNERAEKFFHKALKIRPGHAKAYEGLGVLMSRLERRREAKEYYLKAIEAGSRNSQAHNNLGLWYDSAGDSAEAEKYFLKALELKPTSYQALNNLGMLYGKRGDLDRAAESFRKSLELNPSSARAHTNLGLILYRRGRVSEAEAEWEKALTLDPSYESARRALTLLRQRSSAEAGQPELF